MLVCNYIPMVRGGWTPERSWLIPPDSLTVLLILTKVSCIAYNMEASASPLGSILPEPRSQSERQMVARRRPKAGTIMFGGCKCFGVIPKLQERVRKIRGKGGKKPSVWVNVIYFNPGLCLCLSLGPSTTTDNLLCMWPQL